MIHPRLIGRMIHINWVLVNHGLDEIVLKTHLFRPLRFTAILSPNFWWKKDHGPRGVRIRCALEDLGPIFVKFGQALSTRRDLLPDDIAEELVKLQDKVPSFPGAEARAIIEQQLGQSVSKAFAKFDEAPLASASVAQVHPAILTTGEEVVVKVLRPDVEKRIRSDVALLYALASLTQRFWGDAQRLRPVEIVAEFERTILDELDLSREAGNAAELRRNFENSEMIYIPKIYWEWTREKILVMERIYGIPVGDIEQLKKQNVDLKVMAHRGVEIFFTQVFRDNFFHADMHPGNIFVTPEAKYIAVDFGIVGSLTTLDQHYLAENFIAFFNRNYRRVAELHIESGWVAKDARVEEVESVIRTVCEPIFEKPIGEISFGNLLLKLFQAARRFDGQIQPQLVLFQKTLLNIEGLGMELYPQLNLWDTAKPFLEKWYKERVGIKATFDRIREQLPDISEKLPEMPDLAYRALANAANGKLSTPYQSEDLRRIENQLQINHRRIIAVISGSAFIISASIIFALDGYAPTMIYNAPYLSWIMGGIGIMLVYGAWRAD